MTGSHEVSGSIPLISTNKKHHPLGWCFFVGETRGARSGVVRTRAFPQRKLRLLRLRRSEKNAKCHEAAQALSIPLISTNKKHHPLG